MGNTLGSIRIATGWSYNFGGDNGSRESTRPDGADSIFPPGRG